MGSGRRFYSLLERRRERLRYLCNRSPRSPRSGSWYYLLLKLSSAIAWRVTFGWERGVDGRQVTVVGQRRETREYAY
jgi:hypothetical protein